MIEFKYSHSEEWQSFKADSYKPEMFYFADYVIRIDKRTIFESQTEEFIDAYKKEIFWQHIRD